MNLGVQRLFETRLLRSFSRLALAVCTTLSTGCDTSNSISSPTTRQSHSLQVSVTDGVIASPAPGATFEEFGDTVTYAITAAPGFADPTVWLDGRIVPARGAVTISGNHRLEAVAFAVDNAVQHSVERLYRNAETPDEAAMSALLQSLENAIANDDTVALKALDHAEAAYASRGSDSFPGTSAPVISAPADPSFSGTSIAAAASAMAGTPTTIIFINGFRATRADALVNAKELHAAIRERGIAIDKRIQFTSSATVHPTSPTRLVVHYNPTVAPKDCDQIVTAALKAAGRLKSTTKVNDLDVRVVEAYIQDHSKDALVIACKVTILTEYLDTFKSWLFGKRQHYLDVSDPIVNNLATFIRRERAIDGGRNIILVAHSHGNVLVQKALHLVDDGARKTGMGCTRIVAVSAPFGSNSTFKFSNGATVPSTRVIAAGNTAGTWDLAMYFGPIRSSDEVQPSAQTLAWDRMTSGHRVNSLFTMQHELHLWIPTYMNKYGYRDFISGAVRDDFAALEGCSAGQVTGQITDNVNGAPISGAKVEVLTGNERVSWTTSAPNGEYVTSRLAPRSYRLRVTAANYEEQSTEIVAPFQAKAGPVSIRLSPSCRPGGPLCSLTGTYDVTISHSDVHPTCTMKFFVVVTDNNGRLTVVRNFVSKTPGCQNCGLLNHSWPNSTLIPATLGNRILTLEFYPQLTVSGVADNADFNVGNADVSGRWHKR